MRTSLRNPTLPLLLALGLASALPASAQQQQPPRSALEQRIETLERQVRNLTDLLLQVDALTREVQQLRGQTELQSHAMDALRDRQRDLYSDLDQRLTQFQQQASAPPSATAPSPPPQGSADETPARVTPPLAASISTSGGTRLTGSAAALPPGDPAHEEERYRAAFELLRSGNYGEAATALRNFLAQYPESRQAENAQYWLAESSYVSRDHDNALKEFALLIERHPTSPRIADALLKSGYIHYDTQNYPEARRHLTQVLRQHPDSTAARLAQQHLDRMERENR